MLVEACNCCRFLARKAQRFGAQRLRPVVETAEIDVDSSLDSREQLLDRARALQGLALGQKPSAPSREVLLGGINIKQLCEVLGVTGPQATLQLVMLAVRSSKSSVSYLPWRIPEETAAMPLSTSTILSTSVPRLCR